MKEIGINSQTLREIETGLKTIEGRLAKPRFIAMKPGDVVMLREDIWRHGKIVDSLSPKMGIVITHVQKFASFREMLETLGHERIVPAASSMDEAARRYDEFYSHEDETRYGVLAISFRLLR